MKNLEINVIIVLATAVAKLKKYKNTNVGNDTIIFTVTKNDIKYSVK